MTTLENNENDAILSKPADADDNDDVSDAMLARLRPARDVLTEDFGPEFAERLISGKAGRPKADSRKQKISIRLDEDVLAALKERFPKGWQTEINTLLKQAVCGGDKNSSGQAA